MQASKAIKRAYGSFSYKLDVGGYGTRPSPTKRTASFVMISFEKAHQSKSLIFLLCTREIEPESAANCRLLVRSNQKRTKACVSASAPRG